MSELQRIRQQSMELGRQKEKQEVIKTLTRFAEKGKISQEAMQDILKEI